MRVLKSELFVCIDLVCKWVVLEGCIQISFKKVTDCSNKLELILGCNNKQPIPIIMLITKINLVVGFNRLFCAPYCGLSTGGKCFASNLEVDGLGFIN